MNIFELSLVAAPITGLVAAASAARHHSSGVIVACAIGGFLAGAVAYFGPVLACGYIYSRVKDLNAPADHPGRTEWADGTLVVLVAALSPWIAWFAMKLTIPWLLGNQ